MGETAKTLSVVGLLLLIAIIVVAVLSAVRVPAGNVGIQLNFGRVTGYVYQPGLHWKSPIGQSYVLMNVRTQLFTVDTNTYTKDLQNLSVTIALDYHINGVNGTKNASFIYEQYGTDYQGILISPIVQEAIKASVANFTAEQAVELRPLLVQNITNRLENVLPQKYGIEIDQVSMTNSTFTPEYEGAVENKTAAQQRLLQQDIELNITRVIANQSVALAIGNATSVRIRANATAYAARVIANATRNGTYIAWLATSEWDGHTPLVVGSGATPLLSVSALTEGISGVAVANTVTNTVGS